MCPTRIAEKYPWVVYALRKVSIPGNRIECCQPIRIIHQPGKVVDGVTSDLVTRRSSTTSRVSQREGIIAGTADDILRNYIFINVAGVARGIDHYSDIGDFH